MLKVKIIISIIFVFILYFNISCTLFSDKKLGSFLEGTWKGTYSGFGTGPVKMTFSKDNTGKLDFENGTLIDNFTVSSGDAENITLDFANWNYSDGKYYYTLSKNNLVIKNLKYDNGFSKMLLLLDMKKE